MDLVTVSTMGPILETCEPFPPFNSETPEGLFRKRGKACQCLLHCGHDFCKYYKADHACMTGRAYNGPCTCRSKDAIKGKNPAPVKPAGLPAVVRLDTRVTEAEEKALKTYDWKTAVVIKAEYIEPFMAEIEKEFANRLPFIVIPLTEKQRLEGRKPFKTQPFLTLTALMDRYLEDLTEYGDFYVSSEDLWRELERRSAGTFVCIFAPLYGRKVFGDLLRHHKKVKIIWKVWMEAIDMLVRLLVLSRWRESRTFMGDVLTDIGEGEELSSSASEKQRDMEPWGENRGLRRVFRSLWRWALHLV